MRPEQIKAEVNQLELSEKLTLVEDIWDSIAQINDEPTLSQWQEEITKRVLAVESGNAIGLDFKDSIQTARNRLSQ